MQNISLMKIAGAIKLLESKTERTETYLNLISQHELKLQNLYNEIQKLRTDNKDLTELTDAVNEIKSHAVNDRAIDELQNRVEDLKKDLTKAITEKPVYTYDEVERSGNEKVEIKERQILSPEFKAPNPEESKYSEYGSLDDVLQIVLGNTKISIDRDDKDREVCSITNEIGGLSFKKKDSEDIWLLDRNKDSEMEFHFNTMDNTPLSVNPSGISTPSLSLNNKIISGVANSINEQTINDKTIPTVSAIVKYINTNLQRMNLLSKLNPISSEQMKIDSKDEKQCESHADSREQPTLPQCNISTIKTENGNSILIENESNSFSLKDEKMNITTINVSSSDGLRVGDKFKLLNSSGILCKFVKDNGNVSVGRFVELTGSASKIDDLIVPEVKLTNKLSSAVYGLVKNVAQKEYVKDNKIYKLPDNIEYVLIIKKGLIEVSVNEGSFEVGSLLVAGKSGVPVYNKNNAEAIQFCVSKKVPMAKVISKIDDKLIIDIV